MLGLILLALIGAYISLFIVAGLVNKSWKKRGIWWAVILFPLVIWGWDYPVVYYEFVQQCRNEGGLKVFKQPEKVNRLRLEGEVGEISAQYILREFSPRLLAVEVQSNHGNEFLEFSVEKSSQKEFMHLDGWIFRKVPLSNVDQNTYVLRAINDNSFNAPKPTRVIQLEKNGELYARWTSITYVWRKGIFGEPIGWDCFEPGSSEQKEYGMQAEYLLVSKLLK